MAINDIVESTLDWSPAKVIQVDEKFASHGTFTLSEVRQRYSKKYFQILKRGALRTEAEYYFLKAIADSNGAEIEAAQRQQVESLLAAYEAKITGQL